MKTERKILFLSFLACGTFFFSAHASHASEPTIIVDGTHYTNSTTWKKSESPYLIQGSVIIDAGASLTIENGVVVKFKYGKGGLTVRGDLIALGTEKDRIIFTSERDDSFGGDTNGDGDATKPAKGDWLLLYFSGSSASGKLKYVSILYGGEKKWGSSALFINSSNVSLTKSEVKYSSDIGISIVASQPTIDENTISDNGRGIYLSSLVTPVIRNNSIMNNGAGADVWQPDTGPTKMRLDARYNWWGDASGPSSTGYWGWPSNPGKGNAVAVGVIFDPWLGKEPNVGPDPVIIIPGIMGSWKKDGVWAIDPIFHTYDNLRDEFLANGYEDGEDAVPGGNFFTFPYEWRDSNVDNAKLLAKKIADIKKDTGRPKVDIVAHSMGGLLARQYIESDDYGGDVDQLITVGTPQLGAPKDYVKWEAGEAFFDMVDMAAKRLIALESIENGYLNTVNYIQAKIPSVQELLPTYNYLYDVKNNFALRASYPNNYPRNEFLEVLNSSDKIQRLKNVEFTKIIGRNNDNASTISGYNVINYDVPGIWENGFPKYFNIPYFNDQGIVASDGDKTVPLYSAESLDIPADKTMYFPSEHGALPTDAQKDILEILTGKRPTNEITKFHVPNLLLLLVHSPIDIQVESPSGKKIGKNFDTDGAYNQIEGAYYSGFDTKSEFITIPDPEDGEYKITAQGTDEGGKYAIEVVKITENPENPDNAKESSATIEGNAQPGDLKNDKIFLQQDRVTNNIDNTPPTISISSPKKMDYTNDKILAIDIDAEDAESGVVSVDWQVEKDGQKLDWQEKSVDLSLESLGNYSLAAIATDKAGNSKKETMDFRVTTNLEAIQNNLDHYWELKLVKNKVAKEYFDLRLKDLEKLFNSLKQTQDSKLKPLPKKIAVEAIKKIINADINLLESQINRKSPQWIDPKAADLLVEDLNAIKIK